MNNQLFLSIIIPAYNCRNYIERLLSSILDNGLEKDEYEVIIVDDKSTDNFMELVTPFEQYMNIVKTTTHRDFHCPGNTREIGRSLAKGEWITFIDNDDMFEPDAFQQVRSIIEKENITHVLCTNFRGFDYETSTYNRDFIRDGTDTWLHGKYFNRKNVIEAFDVHFKDDLFSHEDVYFNSMVLGNLIGNDLDYVYKDIFTYKWVSNPISLSRSYYNTDHFYIETYLDDYMTSISEPYFMLRKQYPKKDDFFKHQLIVTLLYGFFYFDASRYRIGYNKILPENIVTLHNYKVKLCEELNITVDDIVNYIYSDPAFYAKIKQNAIIGSNNFVETQSFRDFMLTI